MKGEMSYLLIYALILSSFSIEAGKMIIKRIDGKRITVMKEGVSVHIKDITAEAPEGYYYEEEKFGVLTGGSRLRGKDYTVISDSIVYFEKDSTLLIVGNARYEDSSRIAICEEFRLRGDTVWAEGELRLELKGRNTYLQADGGIFYIDEKKALFTEEPRVFLEEEDTLRLIADTVLTLSDTLHAAGNVRIHGKSLEGMSRTLIYISDSTERAILYEEATVIAEGDTVRGDSILLEIDGGKLNSLDAFGNAELRRKKDGEFGISAEHIRATISQGKLDYLTAWGVREGVYREEESGGSEN